ncbi:Hypothetical_protein [Hexamita inflata]|uniref:Hypothetical_protein n=1 Tax=Hexamita inflata TaxID=28002 RepID=A0AA86Q732_9EUKA|nr:Hypothetical protein HINF_LOCUS41284 [Hexamita inflata]
MKGCGIFFHPGVYGNKDIQFSTHKWVTQFVRCFQKRHAMCQHATKNMALYQYLIINQINNKNNFHFHTSQHDYDKDEVTAQEYIFIFFYFRKLIIVDGTQLKQLVSILLAGVKGVHVTNNIQLRDFSSSLYGSQNSKMQLTLNIAVKPSSPESQ